MSYWEVNNSLSLIYSIFLLHFFLAILRVLGNMARLRDVLIV